MQPKNTPIQNPTTLTILNNGAYPEKSSIPKIKGMLIEARNKVQIDFTLSELKLKSGIILLITGFVTLLIELKTVFKNPTIGSNFLSFISVYSRLD